MAQAKVWDNEYKNPQLVVLDDKPQKDVLRFFKFLKKKLKFEMDGKRVLDLGSGVGKNANYLAGRGASVVGLEISPTAVNQAREKAREMGVEANVSHLVVDIGAGYPFGDHEFDLVLDVLTSNSLNTAERTKYLAELNRVMKPGSYLLVKTLNKEGDKNAKELLKKNPGPEKDTYIMKEMGLVERVFDEKSLREIYEHDFEIISLERKSSYTSFRGQSYKRNFWLVVLKKK